MRKDWTIEVCSSEIVVQILQQFVHVHSTLSAATTFNFVEFNIEPLHFRILLL